MALKVRGHGGHWDVPQGCIMDICISHQLIQLIHTLLTSDI